jgi:hypothetical protein
MAGLKHDALGIHSLPEPYHEEHFDATCNFLSGEVASLQTLNTSASGATVGVSVNLETHYLQE